MSRRRTRALWPAPAAAAAAAWIILACLLVLATPAARARDAPRPLFAFAAALDVVLEAPWSELVRDKEEKRRYPAVLAYTDGAGRSQRIEATVEARGLTRLRECRFPPLRLRFPAATAAGPDFAGQRSLKMVTHCRPGEDHEQYYVQEFLAYRILNLATAHSFRARPLVVTYRDSGSGEEDGPRFAFLIESLGELATRTGHARSPRAEFAPGDFDPLALTRVMMFQYLIGNTDFEVLSGPRADACCHNVRVTGPPDGGGLVAVPYDFDSAGMIDASYAAPHRLLPIRSVTQRLYRGFCVHDAALEPVRAEFLARRDAIFALVRSEGRLSAARRRSTVRYFQGFFDTLGDEARFAREFRRTCRR